MKATKQSFQHRKPGRLLEWCGILAICTYPNIWYAQGCYIVAQAVTIDDIVCVINSGRHKEKSYDPYTNVSTLQAQWISKASERQRRGRAGRCQQVR